jgi:protein-S-isoprenylcysteine O-methyltransferase Ste14
MALLLKNLLFTVLVPGTVAVTVPLLLAAGGSPPAGGPLGVLAAVLLALGAALYTWCVWDFARHGRGTPAPIDAPRRLVVRGPYRVVRNPMYVAVVTVIAGQAALFRSSTILLYGAAVATGFALFVLLYEEPHLRRTFGAEYEDYLARVGRWLPRRPRP